MLMRPRQRKTIPKRRYLYRDKRYTTRYPLYRPRQNMQRNTQYYMAHFNQTVELTSGSVIGTSYRLTSPYDPSSATGGNNAAGFSVYRLLYQMHLVYKAEVTVQFINKDDIQQVLTVSAYPTALNDPNGRTEQRDQNFSDTIVVPTINGGGTLTKRYVFYPYEIFGISAFSYANDYRYACEADNNPERTAFFEIISAPADGAATNFSIITSIRFYIKAWEFKANVEQEALA